jgi:hypothetical protein
MANIFFKPERQIEQVVIKQLLLGQSMDSYRQWWP